jgi:hypothetical protein
MLLLAKIEWDRFVSVRKKKDNLVSTPKKKRAQN